MGSFYGLRGGGADKLLGREMQDPSSVNRVKSSMMEGYRAKVHAVLGKEIGVDTEFVDAKHRLQLREERRDLTRSPRARATVGPWRLRWVRGLRSFGPGGFDEVPRFRIEGELPRGGPPGLAVRGDFSMLGEIPH